MNRSSSDPARPGIDRPEPPPLQSRLRQMWERMQADLRLAVVTLYSICALVIIGSFAVYRFLIGDVLIGVVDSLIVLVFLGLTVFAWQPGWTRFAANVTAGTATLACLSVVLVLELSYLWVFAGLVGNFLMAERRVAIVLSIVLISSIALHSTLFADSIEHFTFIAVAAMVSLFSLIFSSRVDSQHGQLTEMAARDGLTGAFNRRSLDRDLMALLGARNRESRSHCLALMDLDNFKELNDTHGHEAGDEVLIRLTQIVRSSTRDQDRFYRYGGEEFVLLLPDTSLHGATTALEKLRETLARELKGPDGKITVSFGVASHYPGESVEAWLNRSDQALLRAKRTGKDRIEVG